MARIPYPDVELLPERVRATVKTAGLNAVRMFAHATPAAFEHLYGLTATFFTTSRLPADLRQIAILRAGHAAGCSYVTLQHGALARDLGLDEAILDAIRDGDPGGMLNEAQHAVLEFADGMIRDVCAEDAALAAVRRHLDDNQLLDLMMVVGTYMMLSRLIETSGAEVDDHRLGGSYLDELHE